MDSLRFRIEGAFKLSKSSDSINPNRGWKGLFQRNGIGVLGVAPGKAIKARSSCTEDQVLYGLGR
jgi:hypothetical protein